MDWLGQFYFLTFYVLWGLKYYLGWVEVTESQGKIAATTIMQMHVQEFT